MRKIAGKNGGTLHLPDKGETHNPNGRPPKLVTTIIKELEAEGFKRVTASQVQEASEFLIGMHQDKMKELIENPKTPIFLKILISNLANKSKSFQVLDSMLDRAHGKAKQVVEGSQTSDVKITINQNIVGKPLE